MKQPQKLQKCPKCYQSDYNLVIKQKRLDHIECNFCGHTWKVSDSDKPVTIDYLIEMAEPKLQETDFLIHAYYTTPHNRTEDHPDIVYRFLEEPDPTYDPRKNQERLEAWAFLNRTVTESYYEDMSQTYQEAKKTSKQFIQEMIVGSLITVGIATLISIFLYLVDKDPQQRQYIHKALTRAIDVTTLNMIVYFFNYMYQEKQAPISNRYWFYFTTIMALFMLGSYGISLLF
jgi:hypothetical protein